MLANLKRTARQTLKRLLRRYAPWEIEAGLRYLRSTASLPFARRNLYVADEVSRENVLVLAPHPDDEAIGPGGLVSRLLEVGSTVTVVYLTDGGGFIEPRQWVIDLRRQEAERLGVESGIRTIFWDFQDTQLAANEAAVSRFVQLLDELRPTMICLPAPTDHHNDHLATCQITAAGLALRPDRDLHVMCYEVWDNLPWPNYVLNISHHFEQKRRLIEYHATPCMITDFVQLARERAALRYKLHINSERRAAEQGYAEAYWRMDADDFRQVMETFAAAGKLTS